MNIAICDDEKIIRETLSCDCLRYAEENYLNLDIIEFADGAELLEYHEHIDLIFLDIGLPGMSGIELKNHIVLMDNIDYIVFISGYKERVWESFSKKTLAFIIKPFKYENISMILNTTLKRWKATSVLIYWRATDVPLLELILFYISMRRMYIQK